MWTDTHTQHERVIFGSILSRVPPSRSPLPHDGWWLLLRVVACVCVCGFRISGPLICGHRVRDETSNQAAHPIALALNGQYGFVCWNSFNYQNVSLVSQNPLWRTSTLANKLCVFVCILRTINPINRPLCGVGCRFPAGGVMFDMNVGIHKKLSDVGT